MAVKKSNILDTFLKLLGTSIKNHRIEKGLSMEQLGIEMGTDRTQIARIEKGYNITVQTILKLSIALEIPPSKLLTFEFKSNKNDLDALVSNNKANKMNYTKRTIKGKIADNHLDKMGNKLERKNSKNKK